MPNETRQAIEWALQQSVVTPDGDVIEITTETPVLLCTYVRKYFNDNNIEYGDYDYHDLKPYFPK